MFYLIDFYFSITSSKMNLSTLSSPLQNKEGTLAEIACSRNELIFVFYSTHEPVIVRLCVDCVININATKSSKMK